MSINHIVNDTPAINKINTNDFNASISFKKEFEAYLISCLETQLRNIRT